MLRMDINLLFTIINLIVLAVAMRIFLFKPVHKILDERQKLVDQSLSDAEQAKKAAAELEAEHKAQLDGIDDERKNILQEAREKAEGEYEKIVSDAQTKAENIISSAKIEGERSRDELMEQAQTEVAQMVVNAAAKIAISQNGADGGIYDEFLTKAGEKND